MNKFSLLFLFVCIFLLSSCSSERNFSKRKYLPGFFTDPAGKKEMVIRTKTERPVLAEPDSTSKEAIILFVKTEKTTASENAIHPAERPKHLPPPAQKTSSKQTIPAETKTKQDYPDEATRIKRAYLSAWIALALLITGIIFLFFSALIAYVSIAVLLAILFAITGMIIARKLRKSHLPDEAYEGKNKVIFARIIGIAAIILTALYLAILAMVLIALYRWQ